MRQRGENADATLQSARAVQQKVARQSLTGPQLGLQNNPLGRIWKDSISDLQVCDADH